MSIAHQINRYITYTCKKCNWQTAVLAQWADLKPKRCPNKKCGCLFIKDPDQLDIKQPLSPDTKPKPPSAVRKKTKTTPKKAPKKKASDERRSTGYKEKTGSSEKS